MSVNTGPRPGGATPHDSTATQKIVIAVRSVAYRLGKGVLESGRCGISIRAPNWFVWKWKQACQQTWLTCRGSCAPHLFANVPNLHSTQPLIIKVLGRNIGDLFGTGNRTEPYRQSRPGFLPK